MSKLMILSLALLFSCTKETNINPFESSKDSIPESRTIKLYKEVDLNRSCLAGCQHSHSILKNAKIIKTNSVSLNIDQLNSIYNQCQEDCKSISSRITEHSTIVEENNVDQEDKPAKAKKYEEEVDHRATFEDLE